MSRAKFFQRDSLFKPTYVEHDVGGETMRFYPLSITMLWKMRHAVEPLVGAFTALSAGKHDFEQTMDQGAEDEETGEKRIVTHFGAVKPELATMREDRREAALQKAAAALFDPKMRDFVGELLTDSLRDEFTRAEARDRSTVQQMMDGDDENPGLDIATLGEMVGGLVKANVRVFGPFRNQIREMASGRIKAILDDASGLGIPATSTSSEFGSDDENENAPPLPDLKISGRSETD